VGPVCRLATLCAGTGFFIGSSSTTSSKETFLLLPLSQVGMAGRALLSRFLLTSNSAYCGGDATAELEGAKLDMLCAVW
jgi:hypothetical protein